MGGVQALICTCKTSVAGDFDQYGKIVVIKNITLKYKNSCELLYLCVLLEGGDVAVCEEDSSGLLTNPT